MPTPNLMEIAVSANEEGWQAEVSFSPSGTREVFQFETREQADAFAEAARNLAIERGGREIPAGVIFQ